MNGDLPEEWFRAGDARPSADDTRIRPVHGDGEAREPDLPGDERFTDQFKPWYVPPRERSGESAGGAVASDNPGATHIAGTPRPVSGGSGASASGASSAGPSYTVGPDARTGTPSSSAGSSMIPGSFGENSAGTTYSVGEVRKQRVARRGTTRASRVRRVIQSALLLGVALTVGLVGGTWLSTRGHSNPGSTNTSAPSAAPTGGAPYAGPMTRIVGVRAVAQCTADPAKDSSGRTISYPASNMVDTDPATAWRCPGSALGQKLTFTLPAGTTLVGVGIVNGYSKTGEDGSDYYERFRRVLRVQWMINGRPATMTLTDHRRSEQTITIPPMQLTGPVTLTIQATSAPGQSDAQSNATLLSTVNFYTAG